MAKHKQHALFKKFNKSHKKINPKGLLEGVANVGRGIAINKLTDFAGSHYRDDGVRHIHRQVKNFVSDHYEPIIGDEVNNLIPFSVTKKYHKKN